MNEGSRFWARLLIRFPEPTPVADADIKEIHGYFRVYGISAATDSAARAILQRSIRDGVIDWSESELSLVDPELLDEAIRERMRDPARNGIWYESGRIFI